MWCNKMNDGSKMKYFFSQVLSYSVIVRQKSQRILKRYLEIFLSSKRYPYKDTINSIQLRVDQFHFLHFIYHSILKTFIENLSCVCTVFNNENA